VEEDIRTLLEPIARDFNVDVLDIKLGGGRQHRRRLRVTVDRAGGIGSDTLTRISRALSLQLDAADLIAEPYELEVSSPGLGWPLKTDADFQRHLGERIQAVLPDGTSLSGMNLGPQANGFRLLDDMGVEHRLNIAHVARVKRQVDWKKASGHGEEHKLDEDDIDES